MAGLLILAACKKEKIDQADCQRLQNGITTANKEEVKSVITKFISSLPSQTYSEQNLNKLVSIIRQQCGTGATVLCFDCIKTLPSQSEIRISYFGTAGPVEMTVDISYTISNKMVFLNMHD
ncbi:MAG: hypothetical protein WDO71_15605 [Bacteroidota bacterium]